MSINYNHQHAVSFPIVVVVPCSSFSPSHSRCCCPHCPILLLLLASLFIVVLPWHRLSLWSCHPCCCIPQLSLPLLLSCRVPIPLLVSSLWLLTPAIHPVNSGSQQWHSGVWGVGVHCLLLQGYYNLKMDEENS